MYIIHHQLFGKSQFRYKSVNLSFIISNDKCLYAERRCGRTGRIFPPTLFDSLCIIHHQPDKTNDVILIHFRDFFSNYDYIDSVMVIPLKNGTG